MSRAAGGPVSFTFEFQYHGEARWAVTAASRLLGTLDMGKIQTRAEVHI
jgi:hypothetical protein